MYSNFLDSMSLIINLFDLTLSLSASDSIINVMIFFPRPGTQKSALSDSVTPKQEV